MAVIKILDRKEQNSMILKLKFTWNLAILGATYSGLETVIFNLKEMLGILNLRSMCYYKT